MRHSFVLSFSLSLLSCIVRPQSTDTKFMAVDHELRQRFDGYLIAKVHEPFWTIHYSFDRCPPVDEVTQLRFTKIVTKFLQSWLQPLREYTDKPIVADFRYRLNPDWRGATFGVTHICVFEEAPKAFFGPLGIINPTHTGLEFTWRGMNSMPHELGHLFGLADTYVGAILGAGGRSTGGLDGTRGSQPGSIMSSRFLTLLNKTLLQNEGRLVIVDDPVPLHGLVPLGKDDENGITWLYKYTYEGLPMEDCFFSNYELEETPLGCAPKYPLIFELKHGVESFALGVLADDKNLAVNAQDADGMTALHHAVLHRFEEVIRVLLARPDIKPFLKGKDGLTPLQLAEETGQERIAALIAAHPKAMPVAAKGKQTTTWGELKKEE